MVCGAAGYSRSGINREQRGRAAYGTATVCAADWPWHSKREDGNIRGTAQGGAVWCVGATKLSMQAGDGLRHRRIAQRTYPASARAGIRPSKVEGLPPDALRRSPIADLLGDCKPGRNDSPSQWGLCVGQVSNDCNQGEAILGGPAAGTMVRICFSLPKALLCTGAIPSGRAHCHRTRTVAIHQKRCACRLTSCCFKLVKAGLVGSSA